MENIVLIGAGGNCKVVVDILKRDYNIVGVTDIDVNMHGKLVYGTKVLGNDDILEKLFEQEIANALVTLGSIGNYQIREKLYLKGKKIGFKFVNAISVYSIISESVIIGKGNIVMDGAIIHSDTIIGNNTIINTGSIVEHDCKIDDYVHISPGAMIAGGVTIGKGTHIGLGSNIIQGTTIGKNCIIGAGAVVINDIPDNSLAVGVPAKIIKKV